MSVQGWGPQVNAEPSRENRGQLSQNRQAARQRLASIQAQGEERVRGPEVDIMFDRNHKPSLTVVRALTFTDDDPVLPQSSPAAHSWAACGAPNALLGWGQLLECYSGYFVAAQMQASVMRDESRCLGNFSTWKLFLEPC